MPLLGVDAGLVDLRDGWLMQACVPHPGTQHRMQQVSLEDLLTGQVPANKQQMLFLPFLIN